MLRINKMSDYGMLILGDLALKKDAYVSATDIASSTHISFQKSITNSPEIVEKTSSQRTGNF